MARRQISIRGRFLAADRPMDQLEAHAVKIAARASVLIGIAVAFAAYFTILDDGQVTRTRLYGVVGVFVFATVMAFFVFDTLIVIDRRLRTRHERELHRPTRQKTLR